ncbi:MAG TPA: RNase adapter RapZ [Dermatophilaceae bacterium]|nr:RNase adapter RapZ [Dermatophilaceae bacterium]HRB99072.1 RNase adapter RapZ [Dermatophilaceae bacterium]
MSDVGPPGPMVRSADHMVILTGMSGAGRSTMASVLEDLGWYVVDNLPPQMLPALDTLRTEVARAAPTAGSSGVPDDVQPRLAAVVDVRSRWWFNRLNDALDELAGRGVRPSIVFLDATDEALVRRFESVRRPHPLQGEGRLLDGIQQERTVLLELRSRADVVVDTSGLNVHGLASKTVSLFAASRGPALRMAVMSFGFKYGVPLDADYVLDMRFLPNPFWVPELRPLTGRDAAVADFVLGRPGATEFVDGVVGWMKPVLAGYLAEGRRYVTLAVGCTGGKHRSVAVAEALAGRLAGADISSFVVHRDLGRE